MQQSARTMARLRTPTVAVNAAQIHRALLALAMATSLRPLASAACVISRQEFLLLSAVTHTRRSAARADFFHVLAKQDTTNGSCDDHQMRRQRRSGAARRS